MKFGALTAALLPEFQLLPFSNKPPLIVLKLAQKYKHFYLFFLPSIIILLQQNESSNPTITVISPTAIPTPTINPDNALEAPKLYPGFEWEETAPTIPTYGFLLYADYEPLDISITGREWYYSTNAGTFDELHMLRQRFDDHYGQEINRLAWNNSVKYDNKQIQALVADSPAGGTIGYSKIVGGKMRLIMLDDNTSYRGKSTDGRPFSCPCEIELKVFVSDVFSTAELEN